MLNNEIKFEPIIGLEVHVELKTNSKMFCGCLANYFGAEPNTLTCPVCLGLPGALPVPNRKAIEQAVLLGLALDCQIPACSKFDRKHYFYPDLPKGYQISQYDQPLAVNGRLGLPNTNLIVKIRRVHLEEDTGKLIHTTVKGEKATLIDFNRSGVPLVEIVTDPDLRSAEEAKAFLKELTLVIRYLGISDCDMEKGTMRLEPNISVRPINDDPSILPDYKVELKNINSFRFTEKAIIYEINRQIKLLDKGERPVQETRGWDEKRNRTVVQRFKESAHDYRYFPEPDIPPIRWVGADITKVKSQLPELPAKKRARFQEWFRLSDDLATALTNEPSLADWYEEALRAFMQTNWPGIEVTRTRPSEPVAVAPFAIELAKWIRNEVMRYLSSPEKINELSIEPAGLAELLYLIDKGELNSSKAKEMLAEMIKTGQPARRVMKLMGVQKVTEKDTRTIVKRVIEENPEPVNDYKKGKDSVIQFLVGQVMRQSQSQADPQQAKKLLLERLRNER